MLRIPSFHKGNGIHRQYKNVMKSKAIVSGMAVTSFYVAAKAAMSHNLIPTTFFGVSTCHFIKRRQELAYIESLLRPQLVEILKRSLRLKQYQRNRLLNNINKLKKGDI